MKKLVKTQKENFKSYSCYANEKYVDAAIAFTVAVVASTASAAVSSTLG